MSNPVPCTPLALVDAMRRVVRRAHTSAHSVDEHAYPVVLRCPGCGRFLGRAQGRVTGLALPCKTCGLVPATASRSALDNPPGVE